MFDLTNFEKTVNSFIYYLDDIYGYRLFKIIKKEEMAVIEKDEGKRGAYIALQFLIIPHLQTKETASLLKEKLSIGLQINDIDLTERITKKLMNIDLPDRNNCKKELKNALVNSKENLIGEVVAGPNNKIRTTGDWIRDYVGQMSEQKKGTLSEAQYFFQKPYFVKLKETEKILLKKLFSLYKFFNTSSFAPEGFEDDLLLEDEQGRLITTNKGKVVVLYNPKKTEKRVETKIPKKTVNKNLSEQEKQIIELREMANQYPAGSFERKAVEEEIDKLK